MSKVVCQMIIDLVFMLYVGCFRKFIIEIIFMQSYAKKTPLLNTANNNLSSGVLIVNPSKKLIVCKQLKLNKNFTSHW